MWVYLNYLQYQKAAPLTFPSKDPPVSLPAASLGMQGSGSDKTWIFRPVGWWDQIIVSCNKCQLVGHSIIQIVQDL